MTRVDEDSREEAARTCDHSLKESFVHSFIHSLPRSLTLNSASNVAIGYTVTTGQIYDHVIFDQIVKYYI